MPDDGRSFTPDWCLHPGEILREMAAEFTVDPNARRLQVVVVANLCHLERGVVERLLACDPGQHLTPQIAQALHHGLSRYGGASPSSAFWLRFEALYREGLAAGKTDTSTRWTPFVAPGEEGRRPGHQEGSPGAKAGKTFVAMQIVWKLWKSGWRSGRNPRVLYGGEFDDDLLVVWHADVCRAKYIALLPKPGN